MPSEDPLSKRIKRHVIGRRHNFFVATSPGFEPVCFQELLKLKPAAGEARVTPGGVEFEGRLDDCYLANLKQDLYHHLNLAHLSLQMTTAHLHHNCPADPSG